ncbi:SMC-Scp complex subunit ScpB [Thalassolituus hydrocarboniclasticus]|uniref:SMC-Scp complex subunit ScpB n=1 Tax=Thalassolituus hydrocarboniclasticus TaxID=2742796 RepID=A0ABY6ABF0_9GAMM|nr:SMC-Scp complex subunit ScpB [Thalassolituus hydrocarboniclasticus]
MTQPALKNILEAALMAAGGPLSLERMQSLFDEDQIPLPSALKAALTELQQDLLGRGIELVEVASGYRLQVRTEVAPWVARLWDERPQRYSRALLETLALIAYRQPITRGDIEDVRGVVVSSSIMKTLLEREWVRVVGYRDVPGRPSMYATTREFLDYFGLKSLEDLPSLGEIRELDDANRKLELGDDAEARKEPAKDFEFRSDEEVAQRGADVLAATEEDLAKAADIVARVESNLFARDDDDGDEADNDGEPKKRSIGDLLQRLEQKAVEEEQAAESAEVETDSKEPDSEESEQAEEESVNEDADVHEATEHTQTDGEEYGDDADDIAVQRTQDVPSLFNQTPDTVRPDAPDTAADEEDR